MQSSHNAERVLHHSIQTTTEFSCTLNVLLDSLFPMHSLDKCVVELFVDEIKKKKKIKTNPKKKVDIHSFSINIFNYSQSILITFHLR